MATDSSEQRIHSRAYRDDEDFWRVRRLLVETTPRAPLDFNWEVRRWDGWRFYSSEPALDPERRERVRLWETETGRLVGAVHPEGTGDAHLQVDPDYRRIESEMLVWAEERLLAPGEDGHSRLRLELLDQDERRAELLTRRGYRRTDSGGVTRCLRFGDGACIRPGVPLGYRLRCTRAGNPSDFARIADLLNAAFGRDRHSAAELLVFSTHAPSYRRELDLVAEAPDGGFACYVGVPYDDTNRRGIFEPVCTHPGHLRQGLARALIREGLARLQALGAVDVVVGTGDQEAANQLYDGIGFTERQRKTIWQLER